ncbi:MAG: transporter substrate-binding domain-containing protein [Burkholderiaceae bacterium]|nr:transporter substrate-binding domain-containing protein [Burkholderiaceae bacterium]
MKRLLCICWIFVCVWVSAAASAQGLSVQGDLWCPYNCEPQAPQRGYVIDVLQYIFERNGIQFKYDVVPWNRVLLQTREGKTGVAVIVSEDEVRDFGLVIGREPMASAADCVFVGARNKLKYTKAEDLNALKSLGIAASYTYSPAFNDWMERGENKGKVHVQTGDRPGEINAINLALGRLDGIIEDDRVMRHIIAKRKLEDKVVLAGCGERTPLYVAFSPKLENSRKLAEQFDQGVQELRRSGQLAKILAKYGLSDWK